MSNYRLQSSLEWLNSNMHRNYPLVDSMVVQSTNNVYLPSSFLVDMQLVVPYVEGLDPAGFFISSIVKNATSYQVTIGYMTTTDTSRARQGFDCAISAAIPEDLVLSSNYDDNDHVIPISAITTAATNTTGSYQYGIPNAYAAMRGMRGLLYIGSCSDMANISAMNFLYEHSAIMQTCVFVESKSESMESLRIVDRYGTDAKFIDDVTLVLNNGIKADINGSVVTLHIDPEYMIGQINTMLGAAIGNAIKTINGIGPDSLGDFRVDGLDCTQVDSSDSGITISNPCAQPCCDQGGADTAEISTALADLTAAKDVLNNYYSDLATKVNLLQARLSSLIASRK